MTHLLKKTRLFTLIAIVTLFTKINLVAQVSVQIAIAPPIMPVYEQPACPIDGYIWTPGYWAYDNGGYYWVEGVWLYPAQSNFLWTPGYWNYSGGYYGWNTGYWGPHIGYYGGVCYGHGYEGEGYSGGRWEGGSFRYNTAVSNVNANVVHNTYAEKVTVSKNNGNRSSFNGPGGLSRKPTDNERLAINENHVKPNSEQILHEQNASKNKNQPVSVNKPNTAKTEMNKTNNPTKSQEIRTENIAPAKVNAMPKQQNNATKQNQASQSYNAPKQQQTNVQHNMAKQQQNIPQQQSTVQHNTPSQQQSIPQQHNVPQQQSIPQQRTVSQQQNVPQQRSVPQQQHNQQPHGGGGHR
jgi:hypothetical protein